MNAGGAPMWESTLTTAGAAQTRAAAAAIGKQLRAGDLLVLDGVLGAGKTTFTQGLGEGLGVRSGVISPTFVLVRIHPHLSGGPQLVHVDAYRLEGMGEIDDLDLESTLDTSVTVVEWGTDRVEHLSENWLSVELQRSIGGALPHSGAEPGHEIRPDGVTGPNGDSDDDEPRTISISAYGPRWDGQRLF